MMGFEPVWPATSQVADIKMLIYPKVCQLQGILNNNSLKALSWWSPWEPLLFRTLCGVMDSKVTGIKSYLGASFTTQNRLYLSRWLQTTTIMTFTKAELGPPRRILPAHSSPTRNGTWRDALFGHATLRAFALQVVKRYHMSTEQRRRSSIGFAPEGGQRANSVSLDSQRELRCKSNPLEHAKDHTIL